MHAVQSQNWVLLGALWSGSTAFAILFSIFRYLWFLKVKDIYKKGKRKVQGVPQSQTAALPRPQEEEDADNTNY